MFFLEIYRRKHCSGKLSGCGTVDRRGLFHSKSVREARLNRFFERFFVFRWGAGHQNPLFGRSAFGFCCLVVYKSFI
jgi:hypothetical protein